MAANPSGAILARLAEDIVLLGGRCLHGYTCGGLFLGVPIVKENVGVGNLRTTILTALACILCSTFALAQDQNKPPATPESATSQAKPMPPKTHRFWDKENDWLFVGVGASRTMDYFSTLNFRSRGDNEVLLTNDLVDNHAAFAAVEAGATGLSIGVSYLFHHYGHHKLERWVSIVHITAATIGDAHNYALPTVSKGTSKSQVAPRH
jgi:hypothetical protein